MRPKIEAVPTSPLFNARILLENIADKHNCKAQKVPDTPEHELHYHLTDKDGMWLMKHEQQEIIAAWLEEVAGHTIPVTISQERNGMIDSIVIRMDNTSHNKVVSG